MREKLGEVKMKKPPKDNAKMGTLYKEINIKLCLNFTIELVEIELIK